MVSFRPKKNIFICADDYGLNPFINEGVLLLLEAQKISGTSCLVERQYFDSKPLFAYKNKVGVHLEMTPFMLKDRLIISIAKQFNTFKGSFEQEPAFIDGHKHIHVFPMIRSALVLAMQKNLQTLPWVRSLFPCVHIGNPFKKYVLFLLSKGFKELLAHNHIPMNPSFAGLSHLSPKVSIRTLMRFWLKNLPHNGLLMTHPATKHPEPTSLDKRRYLEFTYLMSPEFEYDCTEFGVEVA